MFTSLQKFLAKRWYLLALFLLALVLVVFGLSQMRRSEFKISTIAPLPQYPLIQVYMNHSQASSYREPYRNLTREGDDLEQQMVDAIQQAKYTIELAVQEFRLPKVAHALVERKQAGVNVRVVLENTYTNLWGNLTPAEVERFDPRMKERYEDWRKLVDKDGDGNVARAEVADRDVLTILNQGKVPWLDDTADGSQGSLLMHHKFIVIDGETLVATTANFTLSDVHGDIGRPDTRGNANSLLLIKSRELAKLFVEEFNYLWGDGPGGKPDSLFGVQKPFRPTQRVQVGEAIVDVKFSPSSRRIPWEQTTNGLIGYTLSTARKSINMALFVFSDQQLANTLEADHQRGVEVRALVDPGFVYRDFSEVLDMMGLQMANTAQAKRGKCYYEVDNRPWANPIATVGTPELPKGDKLHHKYGEIDGKAVIVGSHNWSEAANRGNDEFLLVIHHPTVAAHYEREFERLYANSRLGPPEFLKQKIADQLQKCGGTIQVRNAPGAQTDDPENTRTPSRSSTSSSSTSGLVGRVNVNTATEAELDALPGIGPKTAKAIIEARSEQPFASLDDLDAVPGIGPSVLEKIQDKVSF